MKKKCQIFRLLSIILTSIIAGLICYQILQGILNFNYIILFPLFAILSIVSLIYPVRILKRNIPQFIPSPIVYTLGIIFSVLIAYSYVNIKDNSSIILSAGYMDDSSMCIDFRKNGTYKIRYSNILSNSIKYGNYKKHGNLIILNKPVEIGRFKLNDSIIVEENYLINGLLNNYKGEKFVKMPVTGYKERCTW
jgi:hypothetical protein